MRFFLRRHSPLFMSLAAMLVLYIPWLNRGYVNFEFPFQMAARGLSDSRYAVMLDAYWQNQANPLGYSMFLSWIYRVFGFHEWFWLARVPSVVGACLLLIAGYMLMRPRDEDDSKGFAYWSILLILQPMIFAFSTAATAEIFPVGLLYIAIAVIVRSKSPSCLTYLVSAMLFGFSIVTKYNSSYFAGVFLALSLWLPLGVTRSWTKKLSLIMLVALVSGSLLVSYIFWSDWKFDVFVSTGLAGATPNFLALKSWILIGLKYLIFLGLFCAPLSIILFCLNVRLNALRICLGALLLVALLAVGWYVSHPLPNGELDFGQVLNFTNLTRRLLEVFGFLSGVAFIFITWRQRKVKNVLSLILNFGLIPYLILLSASRPTQRYLIYAIPIVLMILVETLRDFSKKLQKIAVGSTAMVFASVSLLGMSYLRAQGNASEQMAVWIEENGLISETSPGVIFAHSGQHFWGIEVKRIRYEVIAVIPGDESKVSGKVLHREPMNVLGKVARVYLLREVSASP